MAILNPRASIIIRAKNEEAMLPRTLAAVYGQTERDFEVIFVDSGSTDATLDIARRFPMRIIEIPPEQFTFGRALNVGCRAARGEFLVFLSAHAVPLTDEWLDRLLSHFGDARVAGVWGGESTRWDATVHRRVIRQDLAHFLANPGFGYSNANAAIRREAWLRQPFDDVIVSTEDKEWALRVLREGLDLIFDSGAIVYHFHPETLRRHWKRIHLDYAAYSRFLDVEPPSVASVVRRIYWAVRELPRDAASVRTAPEGMARGFVKIVLAEIGRYTGLRAGRVARRSQSQEAVASSKA